MLRSLLLAALLALPAAALADPVRPISAEQVADERNLIRIADALDHAVDEKRWEDARSYFTSDVFVDLASTGGGEPGTIKADDLIAGWAESLPEDVASFHLRGNHIVVFQTSSRAMMTSHAYAWNAGGDALWEVWGTYEYRFEKVASGWKIASFVFKAARERGERP